MASCLNYLTKPIVKKRSIGNATTGIIEISSIGAMSSVESKYFQEHRIDGVTELYRQSKVAMNSTERKYDWAAVTEAVRSLAINTELMIPELERSAIDFSKWYDANTARNNAIAAVAIMRNRLEGCEELTLEEFESDEFIGPGLRAKLIEFAIKESNGWPEEDTEAKAEKPAPAPIVTEVEAEK